MSYILNKIADCFENAQRDAEALASARSWCEENQHRFERLPTAHPFVSNGRVYIDFNHLSHTQVMEIVMAFGRPWERTPNGSRIDYNHRISDNLTIRCYAGEPPPNCKIEYEEVQVPARIERRAKIVCKPVTHALTNGQEALPVSTNGEAI